MKIRTLMGIIISVFVIALTILPMSAETTPVSEGLAYSVNSDGTTCTITGMGTCTDTELNIPAEIEGYTVTGIGDRAFYNCSSLTSITIPDSVTSIGSYAFYGCSSLTELTLPFIGESRGANGHESSVFGYIFGYSLYEKDGTTYQPYYFESLSGRAYARYYYIPKSIRSVTITDETNVPIGAFYGCSFIKEIKINEGVTAIDQYAFCKCSGIEEIIIPETVLSIGRSAFSNCSRLTSVTIVNGVTSIGNYAFSHCVRLTSVTIGNGVTRIGDYAFEYCSSLTNINIPDSVTTIRDYAFYNCSRLASVTICNGVTSIGSFAFRGCCSLASVTIPDSVTSIEKYAFDDCGGLASIEFLNKDTIIYDSKYTVSVTATIYGYKGSTAQAYAEKYNRTFVALDAVHECVFDQKVATDIYLKSDATCMEPAVYYKSCECGLASATEAFKYGDVLGHKYTNYVPDGNATCLSDDTKTAYCDNGCGEKDTIADEGSKLDHALDIYSTEVKATCKSAGLAEYWQCTECKKYFADENGETELNTVIIPKDPDNHIGDTEIKDAVKESCDVPGYTGDTYCKSCDVKISDGETIPATGNHTGGTANCTEKAKCEVCENEYGELSPDNHVGDTEIKDAVTENCDVRGYTGDTYCKSCGVKISDGETIPATGNHTGGTATCISKAVCSVCSNEYGDLDKDNHYGGINVQDKAEALCYKAGYSGDIHCSGCNEVLIYGSSIPATGNHAYSNICDTVCDTPECGAQRFVPHLFGGEWQKNEYGHWRICQTTVCGVLEPIALHVYGRDNVCDVCEFVRPPILGDLNGDNVVNSDDAVAILRYLAGYEIDGDIELGDYNKDGVTNSDDAVAILRMLAGYIG